MSVDGRRHAATTAVLWVAVVVLGVVGLGLLVGQPPLPTVDVTPAPTTQSTVDGRATPSGGPGAATPAASQPPSTPSPAVPSPPASSLPTEPPEDRPVPDAAPQVSPGIVTDEPIYDLGDWRDTAMAFATEFARPGPDWHERISQHCSTFISELMAPTDMRLLATTTPTALIDLEDGDEQGIAMIVFESGDRMWTQVDIGPRRWEVVDFAWYDAARPPATEPRT